MRKWMSNSAILQERIKDSEEQSPQVCQVQSKSVEEPKIQDEDQTFSSSLFESAKNPSRERLKVLGVGWDNQRDLLFLDLASPLETINNGTITKRAILGATSKFYDPLGLLSPVIILSKIIFQAICKSKVDWDDPVDSFLHEQWLKLVQDTRKVGVVELKRHYFRGSSSADLQSAQLHGFADASEKAYGAVVYLRVELISGTVFTQLVSSKTRVAPINGETIPRMELMGALILARLISTVLTAFKGTLNIDSVFCWLDSQIALWWIWGVNKEFKQFVQNRVVEIRRLVKPTQWNYCPTESNPADICSRGSMASKLVANRMWWNGSDFLLKNQDFWPSLQGNSIKVTGDVSDPSLELKKEQSRSYKKQQDSTVLANIVTERGTTAKLDLECIISLERFSSLPRLIRFTAYVLRFVSNLKRQRAHSLREVQVGDIVCLHEQKIPRQLWRLGKVERLLRGRDGHVRSAVVRVKSVNSPTSEFRRPLQRLYPLEVNAEPDNPAPHAQTFLLE